MSVTSHAMTGPIVNAIIARRGFSTKSAMIEPTMVSPSRTPVTTESVAAWPICSVLYVNLDSSAALEEAVRALAEP